jgi:hypothetical protein
MAIPEIHKATQHKLCSRGLEAVTFVSNHHLPRHAHDQFGIGVVSYYCTIPERQIETSVVLVDSSWQESKPNR